MLHFKNHQGRCACNKKLTSVAMSDNWKDLEHGGCKNCKKTEQYFMAKQEKSACGRTLDEFLKACNDNFSNVEFFNKEAIWRSTFSRTIAGINHNIETEGLENYRIKSIPSIAKQQADGWNGKTIKEAAFKPKQYTITEDQMNDICNIIKDGKHCNMDFTDDFNEMKDNAFAIKDKALFCLENIINGIKDIKMGKELKLQLRYFQEDMSFLISGMTTVIAFGFGFKVFAWIMVANTVIQLISASYCRLQLSRFIKAKGDSKCN